MKLPPTAQSFIFHAAIFVLTAVVLMAAIQAGLVSETTLVPQTISDAINLLFSLNAFYILPVLLIMLLLLAYESRQFKPARRLVFFIFNLVRGSLSGKFYFMGAGYAAFAFMSERIGWIPRLEHGTLIPLLAFSLGYLFWWAAGWLFRKVVRDRR